MASFSLLLLLLAAAVAVLIPPALSLNCTSQTFSNPNKTFALCMDLPTLNASLHWTHAPAPANTLSVAYSVPTPSDVWVAWGLNPTLTGMLGTQAFIASQNGSALVVNTYNISSTAYQVDAPSNISYTVLNMSAQRVSGTTTIFAALRLPAGAGPVLNQVWQVGLNATLGMHDTKRPNLDSAAKLTLAGAAPGSPAGFPAGSPPGLAASPGPTSGQQGGGNGTSSGGARVGLGPYGVVLVLLWAFSSFFGFDLQN